MKRMQTSHRTNNAKGPLPGGPLALSCGVFRSAAGPLLPDRPDRSSRAVRSRRKVVTAGRLLTVGRRCSAGCPGGHDAHDDGGDQSGQKPVFNRGSPFLVAHEVHDLFNMAVSPFCIDFKFFPLAMTFLKQPPCRELDRIGKKDTRPDFLKSS